MELSLGARFLFRRYLRAGRAGSLPGCRKRCRPGWSSSSGGARSSVVSSHCRTSISARGTGAGRAWRWQEGSVCPTALLCGVASPLHRLFKCDILCRTSLRSRGNFLVGITGFPLIDEVTSDMS
jgi:hypothetical protein